MLVGKSPNKVINKNLQVDNWTVMGASPTIIWVWGALSHCVSALAVQVLYHQVFLVLQHR